MSRTVETLECRDNGASIPGDVAQAIVCLARAKT